MGFAFSRFIEFYSDRIKLDASNKSPKAHGANIRDDINWIKVALFELVSC